MKNFHGHEVWMCLSFGFVTWFNWASQRCEPDAYIPIGLNFNEGSLDMKNFFSALFFGLVSFCGYVTGFLLGVVKI